MYRDCAQGIEDDKNNQHYVGMRLSLPVENFEGIDIPLLICLSCIDLATGLLAKDHVGCLTAGSETAPIFIRSTY